MSPIPLVSKSAFCCSVQFVFCGVNKFCYHSSSWCLLCYYIYFSLLPHFYVLFLLFLPSFLPVFLGFGTPEKEKLTKELLKILHRIWDTLGKNNSNSIPSYLVCFGTYEQFIVAKAKDMLKLRLDCEPLL